jgi:hypothetical protein
VTRRAADKALAFEGVVVFSLIDPAAVIGKLCHYKGWFSQ